MTKMVSLKTRLHSMVIFRSLLCDPVVERLLSLLDTPKGNMAEAVHRYADFTAALYEKGGNLSNYLLDVTLTNDNLYMLRTAQKRPVLPAAARCLKEELTLLEEVSMLTPDILREVTGYQGFLPEWNCSPHDFSAAYHRRLGEIGRYGYGIFAKNHAFLLENGVLLPVLHPDPITLDRLPGYRRQRQQVVENTVALLEGRCAANVLLYGDSGTGKSSTVKAVVNELHTRGLRLIELKKSQLGEIPSLLDSLGDNPLKFILFIDDLSFAKNDDSFAGLKAVLEGSVSYKADNVVVYATSNRRHLIKESFADREGDEIHLADTLAELTSLSERFGLTVTFERPDKKLYAEIVWSLAEMHGIECPPQDLLAQAEAYALRRAGRSPRVAKQFIESLLAGN